MRLECWANESLPSNVDTLSNVLGQNVKPEHLKAVQPFFQIDESTIISPELNDYRQHLEERREKAAERRTKRREQDQLQGEVVR